jgi:hypothetical protein
LPAVLLGEKVFWISRRLFFVGLTSIIEFYVYYQLGFQAVYAMHIKNGNLHIYFAVNTINYCNGEKWHRVK